MTKRAIRDLAMEIGFPEERAEDAELIDKFLAILLPRTRRIFELRYGLHGGTSKTHKEIGEEIGVSRGRIRQIEEHAIRTKLKPAYRIEKKRLSEL